MEDFFANLAEEKKNLKTHRESTQKSVSKSPAKLKGSILLCVAQ
jgi:hypothetical protein